MVIPGRASKGRSMVITIFQKHEESVFKTNLLIARNTYFFSVDNDAAEDARQLNHTEIKNRESREVEMTHKGICRDCQQEKELVKHNATHYTVKPKWCQQCLDNRVYFGITRNTRSIWHLRYKADLKNNIIGEAKCPRCDDFKPVWKFNGKTRRNLPGGICSDCRLTKRNAQSQAMITATKGRRAERILEAKAPLYPYTVQDGVATVTLTKVSGAVVTFTMDEEYLPQIYGRILNLIPRKSSSREQQYYVAIKDYVPGSKNRYETTYIHHLPLGKPPKGLVIDHIDRNSLNNCKSNLRITTHKVNMNNSDREEKLRKYHETLKYVCKNGHKRTKYNTRFVNLNGKTYRRCISCERYARRRKQAA
jgi:hypothetical protein